MSIEGRALARVARPPIPGARGIVWATALIVAAGSILACLGGPSALFFDNVQELVAAAGGATVLALASRARAGPARRLPVALAVSLAGACCGMLAWDLAPADVSVIASVGNVVFVASVAFGAAAVIPAMFGSLGRDVVSGVATDALIVFLAGITALAAIWTGPLVATGDGIASLGSVFLVAVTSACVFALIRRRIAPTAGGPWAVCLGGAVVGASWLLWIGDPGASATVGLSDFMFSAGVLLIARGGVTWDTRPSESRAFERLALVVSAGLPVAAILGSISITAATHRPTVLDFVGISTGAVVATSVARQLMLYAREARAGEAERQAGRRLGDEIRARATTLISLQRLLPGPTPEETARQVCGEALRLGGIHLAVVRAYPADGGVVPLAVEGLGPRAADLVAHPLSADEAARVRSNAANGPWESVPRVNDSSSSLAAFRELGIRAMVTAPLRWNDAIIGDICLATCSAEYAETIRERLSTVEEFGVVAAALLGPAIVERDRVAALRHVIGAIIARGAFHSVFQPVVELATGDIAGYEALTRFDDGSRPDRRFDDANRAGMGKALEIACLQRAVEGARQLPAGAWLSVNTSPELAIDLVALIEALELLDRDVVLEITEHVQVADYARLAEAIAALSRGRARFAVDDAGVGYAGLRHILEVRPHFVKLDIALVRGVDVDLARRAMVAGMALFAHDTGCALIAEGIETDGELATLRDLGVQFGQGYLLGRPTRI